MAKKKGDARIEQPWTDSGIRAALKSEEADYKAAGCS
jgi:hypothetical protein